MWLQAWKKLRTLDVKLYTGALKFNKHGSGIVIFPGNTLMHINFMF
jgi:hypothetical protein